ncbi:DUF3592 domain-containing protein [Terracidiphilus gabretensis]|uniref:DUF3592 domain-containing protein n=1 Tax=Terracidiphilus gabretensis TaxID=1577687 RepID=UPI00071BD331|nr:DUF3592 domain-containing protein [Terracidiphilus gabretensis]
MGGFFLPEILAAIAGKLRRERRRAQSLRWHIANGTITRFTTDSGSPTLPLVDYSYEVNGQTYDGSSTGMPISDARINQVGETMDSLAVRVRYNATHPEQSRILNEDNSEIPFEIDHLAH